MKRNIELMKLENRELYCREYQFIELVLKAFGLKNLKGRSRPLPQIKQVVSHFLYYNFEMLNKSRVAELINCNHATIIHNLKQVDLIRQPNDVYHHIWEKINKVYYTFNNPNSVDISWDLKMRNFN